MTKRLKSIVLALVLSLSLAALGGCGGTADNFGSGAAAPSSFSAV